MEGLFIREFDNGWVVYNRSGADQVIDFAARVSAFEGDAGTSHEVADLDGGFFEKE